MRAAGPSPRSSAWTLAPGVHAVAIADDLVFLSVSADAYLCLPGGAAAVRLHGAAVGVADAALAAELAAAGLIAPAPGGTGRSAPVAGALPPRPTASAVTGPHAPPRWRDAPQAARCLLDVLLHYRGRSLPQILRRARWPAPAHRRPRADLTAVVARFHRWSPYLPAPGKCLLRSFMLLRLLQREGHDAQWVFGVRTWPFMAHCWLQCGAVALDDAHEQLAVFQPIMAV